MFFCVLSQRLRVLLIGTFLLGSWCASSQAQTNFGSVTLGENALATVTLAVPSAATLASIAVVTQGAPNLDFTVAGGGSCKAGVNYAAKATCTVRVNFKPLRAGTRYGAVVLVSSASGAIATGYLQGTGIGSQVIYPPGNNIGAEVGSDNLGIGEFANPTGIAVGGDGGIYITDCVVFDGYSYSGVYAETVLNNEIGCPTAIAVDGGGNLYISYSPDEEANGPALQGLYKETLVNGGYSERLINNSVPAGIAVDGSGNLFLTGGNSFEKLTLQPDGSYSEAQFSPGFASSSSIAVDGAGNVYIADGSRRAIYKETLSNGNYVQTAIGKGWVNPDGVAVDGLGNVYVSDGGTFTSEDEYVGGGVYKETLSGSSYSQSALGSWATPDSLAVDGSGNVFAADTDEGQNPQIVEVDFADPPAFSFDNTDQGVASADSPRTTTVANAGNAALKFLYVSYPPDFPQSKSDEDACAATTPLSPGASCQVSVAFEPAEEASSPSTALAENVTLSYFAGATEAKETIPVSGTEIALQTPTPTFSLKTGIYDAAQTLKISDAATAGLTIYYTTNGETPTSASTKYTSAGIKISATETIKAFAVAAKDFASSAVSATYTIHLPLDEPVLSVKSGTYSAPQTVKVTDASPEALLFYTTNGLTPTASAARYTGPISIGKSETLKVVALATGYPASPVVTATYAIK